MYGQCRNQQWLLQQNRFVERKMYQVLVRISFKYCCLIKNPVYNFVVESITYRSCVSFFFCLSALQRPLSGLMRQLRAPLSSFADRPIDRSFSGGPGPASLCPTAPRRDAKEYAHPEEVFGVDLNCARRTTTSCSSSSSSRSGRHCVRCLGSALWQRRRRR